VVLSTKHIALPAIQVHAERDSLFCTQRLRAVEQMGIYAGKKNEVILPDNMAANLATNNARQVFSRVPGLNIWENDAAGLQMAIGGRGLNPNRLSSFNIRQNGYDISADALGYPESYYTPPLEAVERIVVIRGAAGLQYGPQFGGMMNFQMKEGPADKLLAIKARHTIGSWGLHNTFLSAGGQPTTRLNYYAAVQHKTGDSWRPNSHFRATTGYGSLRYQTGVRTSLQMDFTRMHYLAQQPGGLTDVQFRQDPTQSFRARNWFEVDWNLMGLHFQHKLSERTQVRYMAFGLLASRKALGNLDRINMIDLARERTLIQDFYHNVGGEVRLLHRWQLADSIPGTLLLGGRVYRGRTRQQQGLASRDADADFSFLNPDVPDNSDYRNPSDNLSLFAENVFFIGKRITFTPGARMEYIHTRSTGFYNIRVEDFAGNLINAQRVDDANDRARTILIAGVGATYAPVKGTELYVNVSQNYRSINFSDMRILNPNERIDPNLQDERGYNADLGYRGELGQWLTFDGSVFFLRYANRIGQVLRSDQPPLYIPYRFRTNVGASETMGTELFAEAELLHFFFPKGKLRFLVFGNTTFLQGTYVSSNIPAVEGREVEFSPRATYRYGATLRYGQFMVNFQYSYVDVQYTDATNATFSANAVIGEIPAYAVADLSARWRWRWVGLEVGVNNLTDTSYFTRRAAAYPGPGILPANPRNFYLTLELNLNKARKR
jgi:Fe(3+) dicitrate transport protein